MMLDRRAASQASVHSMRSVAMEYVALALTQRTASQACTWPERLYGGRAQRVLVLVGLHIMMKPHRSVLVYFKCFENNVR